MPELVNIPETEKVDMSREPLSGLQTLNDQYALTLVTQTFEHYERERVRSHDVRWTTADALYFGWLPQRTWEGSTTPRSSLGVPLVFDQVETALPRIMEALFAGPEWFQVQAEEGASPEEARVVQGHLRYILEQNPAEFGFSAVNDLMLAVKSMLLYGLGAIYLEYDPVLQRPKLFNVDIRDIFVDPNTPVPYADFSKAIVYRRMMSVEDVIALRGIEGMNIPGDDLVYTLAVSKTVSPADQTKRMQEVFRRGPVLSQDQSSPFPGHKCVEVLIYWSKTRVIWVLGRKWVAYNRPNPYKFLPFCFAPAYIVPNRFYPMGIADVQEGNQRTMEALLNAHLDELSLAIHPPRKMRRGAILTPSQQRWRPGAVFVVDDVKNYETILPAGVTANVYQELQFLQTLAEMRTGVNSASMGVMRPSNANRTASGIAAQERGALGRLQSLVRNVEQFLLIPALYKLYYMVQRHTPPLATVPMLSPEGTTEYGPAAAFHRPMKFSMQAASRMITKDHLLQFVPFLFQFMVQGPILEELGRLGKTVDFEELVRLVQDATGIGKLYRLVRPVSPEEMQARQTPPPEVMMRMQEKQLESQTRLQMGQMKAQAELEKARMMSERHKGPALAKMLLDRARIENEKELAGVRIASEREKAEIERARRLADLEAKISELMLKLGYAPTEP